MSKKGEHDTQLLYAVYIKLLTMLSGYSLATQLKDHRKSVCHVICLALNKLIYKRLRY